MHQLVKIVTQELTLKQSAFVGFVVEGNNATRAAELAGYSAPRTDGWRMMQIPHVLAAIHAERERHFCGDMATLAVKTITALMENEDTPSHVRFQAAKFTLQVAGHVEKTGKAMGLNAPDKPLNEMTEAELAGFIDRGRKELKVIEAEVRDSQTRAQAKAEAVDDARIR